MSRRWLKGLAAALLLLVVLAGAGSWALWRYFDHDRLVAMLSAEALRLTGRQLHIDGRLAFRALPWPALTLEGVRLANAEGGSRPDMLTVRQMVFEVAARPLLARRLEVHRVALVGVDLLLERDAQGRGNWAFTPASEKRSDAPAADAATAPLVITLEQIEIDDSRLAWRSGPAGPLETLGLHSVRVARSESGSSVDATLRRGDLDLRVKGTSGTLADLLAQRAFPVDLTLSLPGSELAVKGSVGLHDGGAKTRLDLQARITDLAGLARATGRTLALPPPLRLPLTVSASIDDGAALTTLSALKLGVPGWGLSGSGSLDRSKPRPRLRLLLKSDLLDLAGSKSTATSAPASPSARVFDARRWPPLELPALDADVVFEIGRLRLTPQIELQALRGTLNVSPARVDVEPLSFNLAGGSVTAGAHLKLPAGAEPALALNARAQGVMLAQLAPMAGVSGLTGGRSDLSVDLAGSGWSAQQIAQSLNGQVLLNAGPSRLGGQHDGSVLGKLMSTLNPLSSPGQGSELKCIAARLPLRGGVALLDRAIAVETSVVNVVASGQIDLGREIVDLALLPVFLQGAGMPGAGLARLLRVKGPLAAPALAIDLKGTATSALAISAAVASGGLSLLGERLLGRPVDAHPCQSAISGPPAAAAAAAERGRHSPSPR